MVLYNVNKDSKKIGKEHTRGEEIQEFQKRMQKPSRKKYFGDHIAYQLYYQNQGSTLLRAFQRTIYCSEILIPTNDGKLVTKRCRCRWCPTCASISTAKMIAGYGHQLNKFDDLYFVTLTRPTVTSDKLQDQIDIFQERWRAMTKDRYWKKNKPIGIRKMECTIRPNDHYHYHFHLIVQGRDNAQWIATKWLELNPESVGDAQDVREVRKGEYIELFKYFTKLLTKDKTGKRTIDFKRLGFIFETIKGRRVYQPFGGIKRVKEEVDESKLVASQVPIPLQKVWTWMTSVGYVDDETGEILTGEYELPKWIEAITGKIDEEELPPRMRML